MRDSTIGFALVDVTYAGLWPGADLANRFGYLHGPTLAVGYKHRANWYLQGSFTYLLGDDVRETELLDAYSYAHYWPTSNGGTFVDYGFIDINGQVRNVNSSVRGYAAGLRLGYIVRQLRFAPRKSNPNSGLFVELGGQYLRHKILHDPREEFMPYLSAQRLRGYDQLTAGLGVTQAIGYRFFGNRQLVSFYVAFEAGQYFTTGLRSLNWATNTVPDTRRLDVLYGFRVGWALPLYRAAPDNFYYY
jgi:hypothetical protein